MRISTLTVATALLAAGAWLGAADENKDKSKNGPASLVGEYVIVSGEREGQKEPPERIAGTRVRFTDRAIAVYDMSKKHTYAATYQLDTSKKPWAITLTAVTGRHKGEVARGLIDKQGNTVRLIYALPGADLPTSFATKPKQLMFVMKSLR
jgi:uncharacterized protein (TIGR03067 family)